MKPNKEKMLLESFDVLKDNVEENHELLANIFVQLEKTQPDVVVVLWKYLLESHWEDVVVDTELYDSIGYCLTSEIIGLLADSESFKIFEPYFLSEQKVLKAVYQYAPTIDWTIVGIIGIQIRKKKFEIADKLMEYMFLNKKNDFTKAKESWYYSYYDIFKTIVEDFVLREMEYPGQSFYWGCDCNDEEIYDFLVKWSNKVGDPKEKVKINVILSELFS